MTKRRTARKPSAKRASPGIAARALVIALLLILIFGVGGYMLVQTDKKEAPPAPKTNSSQKKTSTALTKQSGENVAKDVPQTEQDRVVTALKTYCQTEYKKVWEGAYNITIDPGKVTASYDNTVDDPGKIDGSYAVINVAKCDTPQLTEFQKFAPFVLYLQKTEGDWQAYYRTQSTPECDKFDGKNWPDDVISQCVDNGVDNGTTRAPKASSSSATQS